MFGTLRARSRDLLTVEVFPSVGIRPESETACRVSKESYDDTYPSHETGTKYRNRSRDRDHSHSVKRWRESESPPSRRSESITVQRTMEVKGEKGSQEMKRNWLYS
ncbi:hypothetical protein Tco_0320617 [Tanacetum coccineum]